MFDSLYKQLHDMQNRGEVTLQVLHALSQLEKFFKRELDYWSNVKTIPTSLAFPYYVAAGNSLETVTGMQERFKNAKKVGDNPIVVDDALEVLPELERAVRVSKEARKNLKSLTFSNSKEILGIARTLRDNAQAYNMYHVHKLGGNVLENRVKSLNSEVQRILENE